MLKPFNILLFTTLVPAYLAPHKANLALEEHQLTLAYLSLQIATTCFRCNASLLGKTLVNYPRVLFVALEWQQRDT